MTTVALYMKYYTFLSFVTTRFTPSICSRDTLVNCALVCKKKKTGEEKS